MKMNFKIINKHNLENNFESQNPNQTKPKGHAVPKSHANCDAMHCYFPAIILTIN